jgi:hypothetical protein
MNGHPERGGATDRKARCTGQKDRSATPNGGATRRAQSAG